jgi:hypothetical protein
MWQLISDKEEMIYWDNVKCLLFLIIRKKDGGFCVPSISINITTHGEKEEALFFHK